VISLATKGAISIPVPAASAIVNRISATNMNADIGERPFW
jgi:hypothetical protein